MDANQINNIFFRNFFVANMQQVHATSMGVRRNFDQIQGEHLLPLLPLRRPWSRDGIQYMQATQP